jgi:hypothetical protein
LLQLTCFVLQASSSSIEEKVVAHQKTGNATDQRITDAMPCPSTLLALAPDCKVWLPTKPAIQP